MSGYSEVKLKLQVPDLELYEKILADLAFEERIVPSSSREGTVETAYYDTSNGRLSQTGIIYQVSQEDNKYQATVKFTTSLRAGLKESLVWNKLVESPEPDLAPFLATKIGKSLQLSIAGADLKELFLTRLKRQSFVLALSEHLMVELVMNQGEVLVGDNSLEIAEIELELKEGRPEELLKLGAELIELYSLLPESVNLYDRGYELAGVDHFKEEKSRKKKLTRKLIKDRDKKTKHLNTRDIREYLPQLLLIKFYGVLEAHQVFLSDIQMPENLDHLMNKWRRLISLVEFCQPLFSEVNFIEIKERLGILHREFISWQRTLRLSRVWLELAASKTMTLPHLALYSDVLASEKQVQEERFFSLLRNQVVANLLRFWALILEVEHNVNKEIAEIEEVEVVEAVEAVKSISEKSKPISLASEYDLEYYTKQTLKSWLIEMVEVGKEYDFDDPIVVEHLLYHTKVLCDIFKELSFIPEKFKRLKVAELRGYLDDLLENIGDIESIKNIATKRSQRLLSYEIGALSGWEAYKIPAQRIKVKKSWSRFYEVATRLL